MEIKNLHTVENFLGLEIRKNACPIISKCESINLIYHQMFSRQKNQRRNTFKSKKENFELKFIFSKLLNKITILQYRNIFIEAKRTPEKGLLYHDCNLSCVSDVIIDYFRSQ